MHSYGQMTASYPRGRDVKVVIEIARIYYERLLSEIAEQDALVSVLKGAGTIRRWEDGGKVDHMVLVCAADPARRIARITREVAPDVAAVIERSIYVSQLPW
jgi:hypothetical protein